MTITPGPWRFEPETMTIRSESANYWLASMNSWDGAVDHNANARLIAAAPDMLAALKEALAGVNRCRNGDVFDLHVPHAIVNRMLAAVGKAEDA